MVDWKELIVIMGLVKQELRRVDHEEMWPWHLPEIAGSEMEIKQIEILLRTKLDPQYKDFLKLANGWKGFYQTVDLFGTNELAGSSISNYAYEQLKILDSEGVLTQSGYLFEELMPIAATLEDLDLFVLTKEASSHPGMIIWFAGGEIERFPNFLEFFLAMIDYNREEIKSFGNERG